MTIVRDGDAKVPRKIAVCPECGATLWCKSNAWIEETGQPLAEALQVDCTKEPVRNPHRYFQSEWQSVIETVEKWAGAVNE